MWSWSFWRDALERAITAAAAAAASVLGTDGMGLLDVAWPGVLNAAALAGLASFPKPPYEPLFISEIVIVPLALTLSTIPTWPA